VAPAEHVERFYYLFFAGLGMLAIGGVNLLRPRMGLRGHAAISLAVSAAVLAGVAAWQGDAGLVANTAGVLAAAVVPCLAVRSGWVTAAGAWVLARARRPAVCWGGLAAAGLAVALGATAWFTAADNAAIDRELTELELVTTPPPLAVTDRVQLTTDKGTPIQLKEPTAARPVADNLVREQKVLSNPYYSNALIRHEQPTDGSNCHGWVFAGGRFWVGGEAVEGILAENGYVAVADPAPGDLVVYRQGGAIAHTGVVRYVTAGLPVLVEGKWGSLGVYLHPVDKSCYGGDYTFYRSPRPGHLLVGLGSSAVSSTASRTAEPPAE
jgi:hypothetical protein